MANKESVVKWSNIQVHLICSKGKDGLWEAKVWSDEDPNEAFFATNKLRDGAIMEAVLEFGAQNG